MDALRRLAPYAACLGAGLLIALSMPPWGWWPLAWIGIAVYVVAHGRVERPRHRAACGFLFGFGWLVVATMWMWYLTAPGYIAANIVFGLYHAAAALAVPEGRLRVVALPVAHTLAEALRMSFPFGGVPLATLGISQVAGPLAPVARVGGVIAITWVTLQLGAVLAVAAMWAWRTTRERRARPARAARPPSPATPLRPVAIGGAVAAALLVIAWAAPRGSATGETLRVAAVQGGGEQGTRASEVPSRLVTERHLEATATIADDADLDLVLWPENVINTEVFAGSWQYDGVVEHAQRLGVPFSVGMIEDVVGDPRDRVINSQVIVLPTGEVTSRYDKVRLVPFGEYVPLRGLLGALGAPIDQVPTNAITGDLPAVLELPDGTRVSTVISWEVFFGGRVREGVERDAGFVTNPTNGASYHGTIVQTQQVASSRLRALETGRWVVQAAPTGFTAIVDPDGNVLERTSVSEQRVIYGEVALRDGHTWYTRLGDAPIIAILAAALGALWLWQIVRGRRSRGALDASHTGVAPPAATADVDTNPARAGL